MKKLILMIVIFQIIALANSVVLSSEEYKIIETENYKYLDDGRFVYQIETDDTVTLVQYYGTEETLVIPSEVAGYSVETINRKGSWSNILENSNNETINIKKLIISEGIKKINNNAFNNTTFEEVILPDSLEYIGESAFERNVELKSITIPHNVKYVGRKAFGLCEGLKEIIVNGSVVSDSMFTCCNNVENIIIGSNVKKIEDYAFSHATSVKSIIINEGVEKIGAAAFFASGAEYVLVPESVKEIDYGAFAEPKNEKQNIIIKNPNVKFQEEDKYNMTDIKPTQPEAILSTFSIFNRDRMHHFYTFINTELYNYIRKNNYDFTQIAKVEVNGEEVKTDVPPIVRNNRVLMPMRAIFESLGATVEWNGETQTITAKTDAKNIVLPLNSNTMKVNNEVKTFDVGTEVIMERTLVPVRAVSESIGADVKWDAQRQTVVVTY